MDTDTDMDMDKSLSVAMGIMLAMVMMVAVVNMVQAATPTPQYTCPICEEKFFTYDELYQHFITAHPAEPIEVIWD